MKNQTGRLRNISVLMFGVLVAGLTSKTHSQEPVTPSLEHKILQKEVGTWDAVMKLYLEGPGSDPVEFSAVEQNVMLGEFWLLSELNYEMFGQKMTGRGQFGFDPVNRKFVGTWCDTSTPYLSTLEGDWDQANRTFTYLMKGRDETGAETSGKLITRLHGDDRKTFEMHMAVPGSEGQLIKLMDVEYTRRK